MIKARDERVYPLEKIDKKVSQLSILSIPREEKVGELILFTYLFSNKLSNGFLTLFILSLEM